MDTTIAAISALPTLEQINAAFADFDVAGDTAGREGYIAALTQRVLPVFAQYNALTEAQKAAVTNAPKLMALKWLLPEEKPSLTEEQIAQIDAQIAQIEALPAAEDLIAKLDALTQARDLTGWNAAMKDAREKVQIARTLYEALSEQQKESIVNIQKLIALEALLAEATAPVLTEEEKASVDKLIAQIDTLPTLEELAAWPAALEEAQDNIVFQDLTVQVEGAREAYNALNSVQQAAVTNEAKLEVLEAALINYEIALLPTTEKAQAQFDAMASDPDGLAAYQAKLVSQAKSLMSRYETLHEESKAKVTNIQTLIDFLAWLEKCGLIESVPNFIVTFGNVYAAVNAEGAELPEGTQFVLDTAPYSPEETVTLLKQLNDYLMPLEQGILNHVMMDMHFADAQGIEIPFEGSAEVTLNFTEPILPNAKHVQVFHISGDTVENVGKEIVRTESGITSVTLKTNGFSPVVIANTSGHILERLDGDFAYIYDAQMKEDENTESGQAISTGTASWDENDEAGNDSGAANNILRTFDVATYTISYKTGLRQEAMDQGINGYHTGTVYFEFILPLSEQQAQFEPGSMGWLDTYKDVKYEIAKEENRQILRGSFLAEPSVENPVAIGNSISELNVAIRALCMKQGDTVQPSFTLWLEGNDVDAGVIEGVPAKLVTGTNVICDAHGELEFKTVTPEAITISAAPRFNVALMKANKAQTSYMDAFDFGTGNDLAMDKDGKKLKGRLIGYGMTLQLAGKDATSGLKGVQVPEAGSTITFDVTIHSDYTPTKKAAVDLDNTDYRARVWSAAPSLHGAAQQDGRDIGIAIDYPMQAAPFNAPPDRPNAKYLATCYDGGAWSFAQDAADPQLIHVTVENFTIDLSKLTNFPAATAGQNGEPGECEYYNPAAEGFQNAWDIQYACFSAGEFWTVQPLEANNKTIQTVYGDGSIAFTIRDENLKLNGTPVSQAVTDDDQLGDGVGLTNPGNVQVQIHYAQPGKGWGSPLTPDCWENGYDWATPGQTVSIYQMLANDSAEGDSRGAAFEMMIKWDDKFFEPNGEVWTNIYTPQTGGKWWNGEAPVKEILWVTRGDGKGWNHGAFTPDQAGPGKTNNYDWNMIQAWGDQLFYHKTLEDAKAAGVPVGLLVQYRGIVGPGMNHMEVTVQGTVKEDCPTGYVYMTTQYAAMWRIKDLAKLVRDRYYVANGGMTPENSAYWMAHREQMIDEYVRNHMPFRSTDRSDPTRQLLEYMKNYAAELDAKLELNQATDGMPDWIRGFDGNVSMYDSTPSDLGFDTMEKIWYRNGEMGGTSNKYLLDCCLVPPHITNIRKATAQTTTQNGVTENKETYSLDLSQRVVDYVLTPSVIRTLGVGPASGSSLVPTVLTITDTLPKELEYISDSAYWGGSYKQDPECMEQGTITDGTKLEPEVRKNSDGTTTLTWTLRDVTLTQLGVSELDPIYFSARLVGHLEDRQGVENTVTIQSSVDSQRELTTLNNNKAVFGITIQKSESASLVKLADQDVVELNAPHGFTMYVGNNSANDMVNQIIVDDFPYNNDEGGTNVHGDIRVTEFTVNDQGRSNAAWFYTTDTQFCGKTSTYYMGNTVAGKGQKQLAYFIEENGWYPMEFDPDGKCTNLPVNTVQVVGVGTIPAGHTIDMHATIELPGAQGGDVIFNNLMMDTLNSRASSRVVSRSLSGLTWIDADHDGLQDENEMPAQSGVKVTLMKKDANDVYQEVASVQTGQKLDVIRGTAAEAYEQGKYLFYNLLPGTYAVRFTSGDFDITYYHPSPVDIGVNDQIDSDGVPTMNENQDLLKTEIEGIYMPSIEALGENEAYHSPNHDSGFYSWGAVLPETGSAGTLLYTFSGMAMILFACALMYSNNRRQRKGAR